MPMTWTRPSLHLVSRRPNTAAEWHCNLPQAVAPATPRFSGGEKADPSSPAESRFASRDGPQASDGVSSRTRCTNINSPSGIAVRIPSVRSPHDGKLLRFADRPNQIDLRTAWGAQAVSGPAARRRPVGQRRLSIRRFTRPAAVLSSGLGCVLQSLGVFEGTIDVFDRAEADAGCHAAVATRRGLDRQPGFGVVLPVLRALRSSV